MEIKSTCLAIFFASCIFVSSSQQVFAVTDNTVKASRTLILSSASKGTGSISASEVAQIVKLIGYADERDKLTCTALLPRKVKAADRNRLLVKTKNACSSAKSTFPSIEIVLNQEGASPSSSAGKILLRFDIVGITPLPTSSFTPAPRPTLPPDLPSQTSELQKEEWRMQQETHRATIVVLEQKIATMQSALEVEQSRLDLAIKYSDAIRRSMQENIIAAINSSIASCRSEIAFYQGLISSYQAKIDQKTSVTVPSQSQIDSWNRLINLYQSSINLYESRISTIRTDLVKYEYWRSVAQKYGDTARVAVLDGNISNFKADVADLQNKVSDYNSKITELRKKISGI